MTRSRDHCRRARTMQLHATVNNMKILCFTAMPLRLVYVYRRQQ